MAHYRSHILLMVLAIHTHSIVCVMWDRVHCSTDPTQEMPEGSVANIGRFPWLGIVQHAFIIGGKAHYAVTGAVLIHPAFAIAAAEDIARINAEQLVNNTKLILWGTRANKYAIDVKDYILHPEYHEKKTFATIALLDLIAWGEAQINEWKALGTMEKEILKMNYVENQVCEEFYYKNNLTFSQMNPVNPLCAVSEFSKKPCVWDGGTALITRQSWGFWKLLGFAVRGPGCGAPTRFLNIHDYVPWMNDVISQIPFDDTANTFKIGVRRVSPIKFFMYNVHSHIPKLHGQCNKYTRGAILFKDSSNLMVNRNLVQGFYFLVITTLAEFTCAIIELDVARQTNAAVWLEHNCHKDVHGLHTGNERPMREKMSCFMYFKTAAYLEIRFLFSFKATMDITLFGTPYKKRVVPNPFKTTQYTTAWWPTPNRIKFGEFHPVNLWAWHL